MKTNAKEAPQGAAEEADRQAIGEEAIDVATLPTLSLASVWSGGGAGGAKMH